MAVGTIPFVVSDNNYRLVVPLNGANYLFDVYWNSRDSAWYLNLFHDDETPIMLGIKVVLGQNLGAKSPDPFFQQNILSVFDTSGQGVDAGFDDLGARVIVIYQSVDDFASGGGT